MPQLPSSPQQEREWERRRNLQRAVLLHLRKHGAMNWQDLFLHFNLGTTEEIGPVLGNLTRWNHIKVEIDGYTTITALGLERLKLPG